ncbi:hypothetical protein DUI87_04008 [Hirundo rustica rustica]|uniref:Uncharacterized protein n=1 Tax=Hirundo rustica rustica TaxID=333673 RepID=A0A3M0L1R3_HIRRU|nr:hypothetical protein DUI87_04008 [Hirundo rustica rustica]
MSVQKEGEEVLQVPKQPMAKIMTFNKAGVKRRKMKDDQVKDRKHMLKTYLVGISEEKRLQVPSGPVWTRGTTRRLTGRKGKRRLLQVSKEVLVDSITKSAKQLDLKNCKN